MNDEQVTQPNDETTTTGEAEKSADETQAVDQADGATKEPTAEDEKEAEV